MLKQISSVKITCLLLMAFFAVPAMSQTEVDSTGFPGDNFSLEGVLELFKKAQNMEDFEKAINSEDNNVNNLDLNEDGQVDYVRVVDNTEDDVHAIVLQVYVNEKEIQDVAVIELEKTGPEEAMLQIIGDEDVYGEQKIVEPFEEEFSRDGKGGPHVDFERVVVNVWLWPCVRFVYNPAYVVWVSPWHWAHYPHWWRPWHPRPFHIFVVHTHPWRRHYHVVNVHRVTRAHRVYAPRRTYSHTVRTKTTTVRKTRTAKGKAGVSKTTTKTTVKTPRGKVTKKTTTTKAGVKTKPGKKAGVKKTTTTTKARTKSGKKAGVKKTTTKKRKRGG